MDTSKLYMLSNLIYQIYNVEDFQQMKQEVLVCLKALIPNRFGTILMAAPAGSRNMLCDPISHPPQYEEVERQYLAVQERDYSMWLVQRKQSTAIKATSLLPDGEREQTEVYQKSLAPYGVHYAAYLSLVHNGELLAVVSLYRGKEEGDFTEDELSLLQTVSDHLNIRFYRNKHRAAPAPDRSPARLMQAYALTPREAEVLALVLDRKDNDAICRQLFISENTLKKHLQNLYRKTGVPGRLQLLSLDVPES